MKKTMFVANADTPLGRAVMRTASAEGYALVRDDPASVPVLDAMFVAPLPEAEGDGPIDRLATEDFTALVDRDLGATMRLLRAALPGLLAGRGSIVLAAALDDEGDDLARSVCAGSLATLARSITYQYGPEGVRANLVALPAAGSAATDDDIAKLVMFIASPDASYMTGTVLRADDIPMR